MRQLLLSALRIVLLVFFLPAPVPIDNSVALAQQQPTSEASVAEITFWNSVKDTTDPEELKAFLEAFPNGTFASLGRIRLKNLQQKLQEATSATKLPATPLAEPIVREVQELLYNLNYAITAINGKLTPEVTTAIRALQAKLGEPITGELTDAQLAKLRRMEIPKIWGAIAALRNGGFEAVWQMLTRREAEAKVLLGCSTNGTPDCKIFSIANKQCAAAAVLRQTTSDGKVAVSVTISRQTGMGPAQIAALTACNKDPQSQNRCQIVSKVCANGGHVSTTNPQREGSL